VRDRYVFLHYHVFAGRSATIDWVLERNLRARFEKLHEAVSPGVVSNAELVEFLLSHPHVRALSSRHFQPPFPTHEMLRFIEICLLRHPLDRLQTMHYIHARIHDPQFIASVKAQDASLPEWLESMSEYDPSQLISQQTAMWGGSGFWAFPPTERHLERAKAAIENAKVLIVLERFDESLVAAEHFLRGPFPKLDLTYRFQNPSECWQGTLNERLERLQDICGTALYDQMRRYNELDEALWEWANQELDRRLAYVPKLNQKLAVFEERRTELANRRRAHAIDRDDARNGRARDGDAEPIPYGRQTDSTRRD
jgi:hypothetical protein